MRILAGTLEEILNHLAKGQDPKLALSEAQHEKAISDALTAVEQAVDGKPVVAVVIVKDTAGNLTFGGAHTKQLLCEHQNHQILFYAQMALTAAERMSNGENPVKVDERPQHKGGG